MKIILQKKELLKLINNEKKLGFVPTMGAIHDGHISLIKRSIKECSKTIVTIFINRPQFNKISDYSRYPRRINNDVKKLKKFNIDFLYLPTSKQIYPFGENKKIKIHNFKNKLCGKYRPGHFEAVVDVVNRFIKLIKPQKIYLGEKDMQQLKILEDFVRRNYKYIKIIPCKTIRENNGIALSSRNYLLKKKEKIIASKVYKFLYRNKKKLVNKKISLINSKNKIYKLGIDKIDYLKVININKIIQPFKKRKIYKIFIAYYISKIRLIDNI